MKKSPHPRTVFLTGATGLVGSYLLKILLQHGHKVYCLAREKKGKKAKDRIIEILNFWDKQVYPKYRRNLVVIEGDIVEKDLGLTQSALCFLKNTIEEIFHCAAVIDFNWPLKEIRKVNVGGTRNVLDFALSCKNLKKVNHLSTAYVCGDHKGIFSEKDLDVGQKFNTTYEQSKFEAEKIVETFRKKGLWIDVYRPALILGESKTGKIPVFQGFYQTLQLWKHELFDIFPGEGLKLNVVPVDQLCRSILKIGAVSAARNKNYHTFLPNRIPLDKILNEASKVLKFKKPRLASLKNFNFNSVTPVKRIILKKFVLNYSSTKLFNLKTTVRLLKKNNFEFRQIRVIDYLNFLK